MARFHTVLDIHEVKTDTLWQLDAPLTYESDLAQRTWTVPAGFVTDFASVPRLPLAYLVGGGIGDAAAVIHDYLYQTHDCKDRGEADRVFREALTATGTATWRGQMMYMALRLAGSSSWKSGPDRMAGRVPYNAGHI